ncbi:DNA alkylation repair protein [Paenibacillus sp. CAU 1782]
MKSNGNISLPEIDVNRKGPVRASEIRPEVLQLLNSGQIETVNLTEWLAVDHFRLLGTILNEVGMGLHAEPMLLETERIKGQSTMKAIPLVAEGWLALFRRLGEKEKALLFHQLATHHSDSVRCWAAYIVGLETSLLEQKLEGIRRFAADRHFGVREIAWMAIRDSISSKLDQSIALLEGWVLDEDANVRRFAIEATRPRGVWARHIMELKERPEQALSLLEPLKSDHSKYVQDSVTNWLNDAAKSRPDWVADVCRTWLEASDERSTKRIVSRAQRNLNNG